MNKQDSPKDEQKAQPTRKAKKLFVDVAPSAQKAFIQSRHVLTEDVDNDSTTEPLTDNMKSSATSSKPNNTKRVIVPVSQAADTPQTSSNKAAKTEVEPPHNEQGNTAPNTDENLEATAGIPNDTDTQTTNSTATQKLVEEAAKSEKREKELEELINSRQFFVPVNTVEQKRSIRASIGMTILILILGFALIDLMLDTGAILLVQKIPHTHFFTTN